MAREHDVTDERIKRRTVLRLGATVGALSLTGCLGDNDSDAETDDGATEPAPTVTPEPTTTPIPKVLSPRP